MGVFDFLKLLFRRITQPMGPPPDIETLRRRFKVRYLHFKLLLTANNKAMELMADLEMALQGNRALDMGFIRSRATRITANVFQIIRHLDRISPDKYQALLDRYGEIQSRLHRLLTPMVAPTDQPLVMTLDEVGLSDAGFVGRKMASIGEVGRFAKADPIAGITIPKGFVVTTEGYHRFMATGGLREEVNRIVQSLDAHRTGDLLGLSRRIESCILNAPLPEELSQAILSAFDALLEDSEEMEMAFRSSAIGEDEPGLSFAGMYCSCLHIKRSDAISAYKQVVAGTFSPQAISYRWKMGIRDMDVAMGAGVMPMVAAKKGGVAYSRNPLNRKESTVIVESAPDLPVTVVNGNGTDRVAVSRTAPFPVVRRERADPAQGDDGITDSEASHIAGLSLSIEQRLGRPQDIEWAMEPDGRVVVLQCRPLAGQSDQEEENAVLSEPPVNAAIVAEGGVMVSSGTAAGKVFVARSESDVSNCPDNAVLVICQPLPIFATLIHRIQAVVSERGGIAGHLASVCRQFKVPSLFGIDIITDVVTNGEEVTVDADRGRIYLGRVPGVENRPTDPPEPFQHSRVFRALKEVTGEIIPLNLMDPDASEFKPASCCTFHDITRFSHEKAVREMFAFGVKEPFPGHASKQLIVDQPMQFWLIDLDDGFDLPDPDSPYVRLEEIASIPMLALWNGMTAVPWKGPPPVNPGGFMEILFGSTSDPSLVPSMPSGYFSKNYFMVSKHFMSLQSRFGYHYSTVETLVSGRAIENYVSFNFKGGAAGLERRARRAKMIAEVLEEQGFRVKRYGDGVRARIEGFEQSFMISRIATLGYLLMHTRQLDMDMSDDASIQKHKRIILKDLAALSELGGI